MKVLFFWMNGCPHCDQIKEQLKQVPESKNFVAIEKANVSDMHRTKYGVKSYPTLIFLSDNNAVLGKLVGVHKASEINHALKGYENTDKIIKKSK